MSQRNRLLIDPQVQWAIIRKLMMHWCLTVLTLVAIGVGAQLVYAPSGQSFAQAVKSSFGAQLPLLCVMMMLVPVYLRDIVRLSNRFAGPMLRLRGILNELAEGRRAGSLKFRPGDFWQETATDFNRFYDEHLALLDRCEELQNEINSLSAKIEDTSTVEMSP